VHGVPSFVFFLRGVEMFKMIGGNEDLVNQKVAELNGKVLFDAAQKDAVKMSKKIHSD
jgi:hypothetical protein